jgi:hypothetical protein
MKKNICFVVVCLHLLACKPSVKEQTNNNYYPLSIKEQVVNFKKNKKTSTEFIKIVVQNHTLERKIIAAEEVYKDIETFTEFDINKPAWKNSYKQLNTPNYTRFLCLEKKLTLKYIDVYGDLNKPSRIYFYFQNANNLYSSSKIIDWNVEKSYSIFSIQDVKGMDADTLFVKTTW